MFILRHLPPCLLILFSFPVKNKSFKNLLHFSPLGRLAKAQFCYSAVGQSTMLGLHQIGPAISFITENVTRLLSKHLKGGKKKGGGVFLNEVFSLEYVFTSG